MRTCQWPNPAHVYLGFALLLLFCTQVSGQDADPFPTPGSHTFTVPPNVYEITVEVWGAGGRGGSITNGTRGAGGGGGGAFARSTLIVTPGQELDLYVGAGSSSSAPGEDSWFDSTGTVLAEGGASAANNSDVGAIGGSASNSIGDTTFSGGTGADGGGAFSSAGGGGSSAGDTQNGTDGSGSSGGAAPSRGGDGGDGSAFFFGGNGDPGDAPGGGGGGARGFGSSDGFGGGGANGLIVVTYTELPVPPAQIAAEWRMDEAEWNGTGGEITDSSGNGNDGTARTGGSDNSFPDTLPAKVCNGGRFRGQGFNPDDPPPFYVDAQHYADAPDNPGLSPLDDSGAMSTGGWFRLEAGGGTLIHKGEGGASQEYRVFVDGNLLKLDLWNRYGTPSTATISTQPLQLDTWYFFAATAFRLPSGNDVQVAGYLYDESGQIGSANQQVLSVDYTNKDTSGRFFFGGISFGGTPTGFFEGLLDEIRIYSGILQQAEIDDFWSNSRPCPDFSEMLLEYRFEQSSYDGSPGEVLDSSGNARDGTASGDADTEFDEPAIPGDPGTCRYATFEASGDFRDGGYVQSPDLSDLLSDTATMTFWIRTTQTSDNTVGWQSPGIAGIEDDGGTDDIFWGWIDETGRIGMSVGNDFAPDQSSTAPINDGTWRHVALTWDRNTGDTEIFIDGALDQTGNTGNGNAIGNSFSGIGRIENTNPGIDPFYFDGELDELRVYDGVLSAGEIAAIRNETWPCETGYDHIRLIHPETGLTCSPSTITVQACADSDCTSQYPDPVEIDFISPAATWNPNPAAFTGSTTVTLKYTTPGIVTLDAAAVDPATSNPTRCFSGGAETNCEMEFLESGFIIDVPDHVADTTVTGSISAVKSDPADPEQCVPGFDDETRDVGFWSEYVNPASGSLSVSIDGGGITTASPGTAIPIAFDGNGVGTFDLQYPDVGDVELNARFEGSGDEAGLIMTGEDRFITRPARFSLDIPGNPAATDHTGDVFATAGVDFEVTVAARNASDGITPNFGNETSAEDVDLELSLVEPSGGAEPGLAGSFSAFGNDCNGGAATPGTACGEFSWPEVGVISLTPRLASGAYLGTVDVVGTAVDHVGRFIPAHFELSGGTIVNRAGFSSCSSSFTYIGERFDAEFTLTARNAEDTTTANYEGLFAFLDGGDLDLSGTPAPNVDSASVAWMMGVGAASAQLALPRSGPEGPYPSYQVTTAPVDSDGVGLSGNNAVGSTELRYGRLVIDSAIGSELGPLELPWRSEYWGGTTWLVNSDDDCTALDLVADVELSGSGGDTGDGTEAVSVGTGSSAIDPSESQLTLIAGSGSLNFTSPGSPGWVDALLGLDTNWTYLRDDLDDDGSYDEDPQARASFGLFDGGSQRIFIREIPPQ